MTGTGEHYDVVIVGGGINGAGIARDAALRGLSTLLLEAADFGSGTSSWSSRLIHGGLRYLEYGELPLVYESLHERRNLLRIAPHLVRPLRLLIPLFRGGGRPPWLVRLGMVAYDLLSLGKSLPRHRMLSVADVVELAPGIATDGLKGGASYFDAQATFVERLVIENVLSAAAAGATVKNYCRALSLESRAGSLPVLRYRDESADTQASVEARCIVNAAGPWVDRVLEKADRAMPRLIGGTKGSHIIVDEFDGAPRVACYVEAAADDRPVFIIPWNGQFLIGTTDIRYDGDPAEARAEPAEVTYLLDTVNAVFPSAGLRPNDVNFAYSGVRPLPHVEKGPESAITRRHIVHRHEGNGLLSIVGGKLTTFRSLAEQVVDRIERDLGRRPTRCDTGHLPLPGGGEARVAGALGDLAPKVRERLAQLYGGRCSRLAELCEGQPALAAVIDERHGIIAAEVVMALRDEFARTLTDIMHRRIMVGLSADLGASAAGAVLAAAAAETGWDDAAQREELAALERYNRRLQPSPG